MTDPRPHTGSVSNAVDALLAADGTSRDSVERSLRSEVEMAVQRMRDEGMTPEKVLVRVKSEVRAACASGRETSRAAQMTDGIVHDVVCWSIAEYYRTPATGQLSHAVISSPISSVTL